MTVFTVKKRQYNPFYNRLFSRGQGIFAVKAEEEFCTSWVVESVEESGREGN